MISFQTNSGRRQRFSSGIANSRLSDGVGGRSLRSIGAIVDIDLRTNMKKSGTLTLRSQRWAKS